MHRKLALALAGWALFACASSPVKTTAAPTPAPPRAPLVETRATASDSAKCYELLAKVPHGPDETRLKNLCEKSAQLDTCSSVESRSIRHIDFPAKTNDAHRILVLGSIHGDEWESSRLVLLWAERMLGFSPRNAWRIIPIANPDGFLAKTRTNAGKIDLNRNFPTVGWKEDAQKYWAQNARKDSRRFPGETPASEPELRCLLKHIEEFHPDFVISVHTPYQVLDFDGPMVGSPASSPLRWHRLGNFPGSLGRYLWRDRKIPVLTVELGPHPISDRDRLKWMDFQDRLGDFMLRALALAKK